MKYGGLMPALVTVAALVLPPAHAQWETEWEQELTFEIEAEHACDVAFLSHVLERQVNGVQVIIAKAHCMDQRSYDAQRLHPLDAFTFTECEAQEQESC